MEGLTAAALGLAVRTAILLLTPHALQTDPDGYRAVGENLIHHGVLGHGPYPTAVRPPLYPMVLAGCALFGDGARGVLGLIHVGMGMATVWLAWDLARQCRIGRWGAWIVGLLVACDPILLRASSLVMTETLAALLATGVLNLWCRWFRRPTWGWAALGGAVMGLGVLCRPEWLLWVVAGACLLGISAARRSSPHAEAAVWPTRSNTRAIKLLRWTSVGAYAAAAGLVLAPWPIRNALQLGWPVLTTTHGGYTMLLANNPWLYEHLRQDGSLATWNPEPFHQAWAERVQKHFLLPPSEGDRKVLPPPDQTTPHRKAPQTLGTPNIPPRRMAEVMADRWAYQESFRNIGENPSLFARAVLLRWGRLWQLAPSRIDGSPFKWGVYYGCLLWYAGEFALAIWGIWVVYGKGKRHPILRNTLLFVLVWAGLLTGVHAFYWTEMRMRSPLTAGVALAVVSGLPRIFSPKDRSSLLSSPS